MKTIEIVGPNQQKPYHHIRYASRAIIIKNNMILLSCASKRDLWMIPGGGIENDETASITAIREVEEETGHIIKSSEVVLEVDEYYEDFKYVTYYVLGEVIGECPSRLTSVEVQEGLEARWLPLDTAIKIFNAYNQYTEEEKYHRGIYLRESKALAAILNSQK